jgi:hypothetical protein
VLVVFFAASAEAGAAVTRVEVRWTSNPPGHAPHLRALAGREAATAGCWPAGGLSSFGPCSEIAQAGWEARELDPQGIPQRIAYVDRSSDQRRRFEFEAALGCTPCSELPVPPVITVTATIRNADGSTRSVPPFTLGAPGARGLIVIQRQVGVSAGRTARRERRARDRAGDDAFYGARAVVTGGVGSGNSDDPTVRMRVARDRRTLDVLGPHDDCDHGSGGFNAFEYFYPKVDDVKVQQDGRFQGSTTYVQRYESASQDYELHFKVSVKGRFVSADTAKGSLSWQMTLDGTRNLDGPGPCPPLRATFTVKRGKVVGLRAVKMQSRTRWHGEGRVP